MKFYKKINIITGWVIFAFASVVYLTTIEPSASFWDCGEFIAASYKLEVGHPPGAPLFLLVGRLFTIFAGDNTKLVPVLINSLSALASAFTILFLFWTITHLAQKTIGQKNEYSLADLVIILGSGIIGSLSYTFSDTFWFSAVEGEVYASSSFFTAIVFWAILKWENEADQKYSNRWLILIAYLMGLSIGVHLLNLLAIPAIVLIYYFRKYSATQMGVIYAILVSFLILLVIMYVVISGFVKIAVGFERLFVNGFKLPYSSGVLVYLLVLMGLIIFGILYTRTRKLVLANTIILSLTVILIGYSSYSLIMIRSMANPPMDQNNPENLYNLLYYLNREQYGDRPLIYGQYFNASVKSYKDGKPVYAAVDGKYKLISHKPDIKYKAGYTTLLPRMWSNSPEHIEAYMLWAGLQESDLYNVKRDEQGKPKRNQYGELVYDHSNPKSSPGFIANIKFLIRYQLGHMYFRYFMWNFSGRQNDIQSHFKEEVFKGNWITGINALDKVRLNDQNSLPRSLIMNKAQNKYFMLPLVLGLIGMFFQFKNHQKDFWVVMTLFFMTGVAIVLYLNQNPIQPRERDYAYAGSFYAFAIWIGLSVPALFKNMTNSESDDFKQFSIRGLIVFGVLILLDLASNRTITYSLSAFYVIALILAIKAFGMIIGRTLKKPLYVAILAVCIALPVPLLMANENWDDHDRSGRYFARDFAENYLNSCAPNAVIFTNGDNDTFPLWYVQEVEGVRTDVRVINLSYLSADWYINQMRRRAYNSDPLKLTLRTDQYQQGNRDIVYLINRLQRPILLQEAINFVARDEIDYKTLPNVQERVDYIPQNSFILKADSAEIFKKGILDRTYANKFTPRIEWTINRGHLYKNLLTVLDIMATNLWDRPVYYAITVSNDNYLNLQNYFDMQGFAYRIVPANMKNDIQYFGGINSNVMYENMMNKFKWGGLGDHDIYYDENIRRMLSNTRNNFASLASALITEGKTDSARNVMNKCLELMPEELFPYDLYMLRFAENWQTLGETEKARDLLLKIKENTLEELDYYLLLSIDQRSVVTQEIRIGIHTLREMAQIAAKNENPELSAELNKLLQDYARRFTRGN